MTTIRSNQSSGGYAVIPNKEYQGNTLSLESLGFFGYCLSLPAPWEIRPKHLMATFNLSRDHTNKLLKGLVTCGYLEHSPATDSSGKLIERYYTLNYAFNPVNHNRQANYYTKVSNPIFQNTLLSFKAKGLLAHLLTFSDSWNLMPEQVAKHFAVSLASVTKLIKELKAAGYLAFQSARDANGRIQKGEYIIYERPMDMTTNHNNSPWTGLPMMVEPAKVLPAKDLPVKVFPSALKIIHLKKETIEQKINKEKAAAEVFNNDLTNSTSTEQPAAAFLSSSMPLKNSDLVIGEKLTINQKTSVQQRLSLLSVSYYAPDKLSAEVMMTLVNPMSYSNAGTDFNKKLNTIIKAINEGRWTPPAIPKEIKEQQRKQAVASDQWLNGLLNQRSAIFGEMNSCQLQIDFHRLKNNQPLLNFTQNQLKDLSAQLKQVEADIRAYKIIHQNDYQAEMQ